MSDFAATDLAPGLYIVATPIGTARDITLRALDVLASADVIAAEDTRNTRHLMDIHGIALSGRKLVAYHDHNGQAVRPQILQHLSQGKSVAYVSDAGTPLVADPGYQLVREVQEAGHLVTSVPGPSAVTTALTLASLPTDRFLFAGFLPAAAGQRRATLAELGGVQATLVFFETGKRLAKSLTDISAVLGGDRQVVICRELTKKFEEVRRGAAQDLAASYTKAPPKGEIVLLIDRAGEGAQAGDVESLLAEAVTRLSTKEAADEVSARLGLPRRQVYQMALKMKDA